jgi:hypothetical protein
LPDRPKKANGNRPRSRQIQRVNRGVTRTTRTLFSVVHRFHGTNTKIVRIFTHVPYDCGSSNKNDLRAAEISRPGVEAPPQEVKIPTA